MLSEMKQLFFFVILLLILGIAGFLYRNTQEAPMHGTNATGVACQTDAKVCPDGTSIGRSGPSCEFAACPFPNVELSALGISFVLPTGFAAQTGAPTGDSLAAAYEKNLMADPKDAIAVRHYAIPAGKNANDVMLAETTYETSGNQPKTMQEFTPVIINGKTYQTITVERFEAQVHTLYYLPRDNDVIRFEALDHTVTNWSDASLDIRSLPTHKALESMLATLQTQ